MNAVNHWSTFTSSLALWYAEFSPPAWDQWTQLELLAENVLRLGRLEEIFSVDGRLIGTGRHDLLGQLKGRTRLSVHGSRGIEERFTTDLGADLLQLRPDLPRIPHVPAITVNGPLRLGSDGPAYFVVGIGTDIWFPRIIGANDLDAEVTYDNSILANCHTPRLNRFLAGVRDAAEVAGARWEYDLGSLPFYADLFDENGVCL